MVYRWQIHPVDDGPLRYILVADQHEDDAENGPQDANVKAIYYHIGNEGSVFAPESEGVLLVPGIDDVNSTMVVASLVRLLALVRGMRRPRTSPLESTPHDKRSLLARIKLRRCR